MLANNLQAVLEVRGPQKFGHSSVKRLKETFLGNGLAQ